MLAASIVIALVAFQVPNPPYDFAIVGGKIKFIDLARPRDPYWLRLVKFCLSPVLRPITDYNASSFLAEASKRTQLSDFGNDSSLMREGLDILVNGLHTEAKLSPMGSLFTKEFVVGRLEQTLRLTRLLALHPEILQEQIEAPLIIAGLPRTGTTHLHALLAASGDFRYIRFYEGQHALEVDIDALAQPVDPRIKQTEEELWFLNASVPLMQHMVKISPTAQVEDIYIESGCFASMIFESVFFVPSYVHWLRHSVNQTLPLLFLKKNLQALQWLDRRQSRLRNESDFVARRFVLKTPAHFERIPALLTVFPDAKIIVTHRDIVPIVKSVGTMMSYLMRLYSADIDPTTISWAWVDRVVGMLQKIMEQDQAGLLQPYSQIIHVQAEAYWKNTLSFLRQIYSFLGISLQEASEAKMAAYLLAHPQLGSNSIHYSLETLGLTEAAILAKHGPVLEQYHARFIHPTTV